MIFSTRFLVSVVAVLSLASRNVVADPPGFLGGDFGDKAGHLGGDQKGRSQIQIGKQGGRMIFCPSGDCTTGKQVDLRMSRLVEIDPSSKELANKAQNFNKDNFEWSKPVTTLVNGVNKTTTFYDANVTVGNPKDNVKAYFKITVDLYDGNTTAANGKQTIFIPAGSLKFTLEMKNWPFVAKTNRLLFGVDIRSRDGNNNGTAKLNMTRGTGKNGAKLERFHLQGNAFLDAPSNCVVDGADANVTMIGGSDGNVLAIGWSFPYFNSSLYYDPVVGESSSTSTLTSESTDKAKNAASMSAMSITALLVTAALSLLTAFYS